MQIDEHASLALAKDNTSSENLQIDEHASLALAKDNTSSENLQIDEQASLAEAKVNQTCKRRRRVIWNRRSHKRASVNGDESCCWT